MNCDFCGREINFNFNIENGKCYCEECEIRKKIKYYSFEDFEYNAIIMATDIGMALEGYYIEIDEVKQGLRPKEIDEKDALLYFIKASDKDLYGLLSEFFDIKQKFIENINQGYLQYEILLLDSWLC